MPYFSASQKPYSGFSIIQLDVQSIVPEYADVRWVTTQSSLWRRLDLPGHESARLSFDESVWRLTGTAVLADEHQPCRLEFYAMRIGVPARHTRRLARGAALVAQRIGTGSFPQLQAWTVGAGV